jgi:hypothetical protein
VSPRVLLCTSLQELPNLNFEKWTRAIPFADHILIVVKAITVAEVENFTNMGMSKIAKVSKEIKIYFNDQKSRVMLIT